MKKEYRRAARSLAAVAICILLGGAVTHMPLAAKGGDKHRERAERALREGEFGLAEKIYREILAQNTRDIAARLGLSFALLKQRNYQDAYDAAARVISLEPMSARAHALLARRCSAA